jgi:flagellin
VPATLPLRPFKEEGMGLRINTNTVALNAQFQLRNNTKGVSTAMEKLSSGFRINKASDDPAALAISENMRADIRNLKQADKNAQDGISLTQVADENLNQIAVTLIRLRELAIQASTDTVSEDQRSYIGLEYKQMLEAINKIATSAQYNGIKLLVGEGDRLDFQINTNNTAGVDRISIDMNQTDMTTNSLGIENSGVDNKPWALDSINRIDNAITNVIELRATLGSIQNRLMSTAENIASNLVSLSAANSRIRDTDIALESSELAKNNLILQSGTAILAQANQLPGQALTLLNKG